MGKMSRPHRNSKSSKSSKPRIIRDSGSRYYGLIQKANSDTPSESDPFTIQQSIDAWADLCDTYDKLKANYTKEAQEDYYDSDCYMTMTDRATAEDIYWGNAVGSLLESLGAIPTG